MFINIGPWWVYDLMIFLVILGFTIWGIKRGTWVMVYFGSINIIVAITVIFLVPLLTTATVARITPILNLQGLVVAFGKFDEIFQSVFNQILSMFGSQGDGITINTQGTTVDFINAIIAVVLNIVYQIIFFVGINIIGVLVYFIFARRRLIAIKINSHVNALIGAFIGLFLGLLAAFAIFSTASSPFFKTRDQAIIDQSFGIEEGMGFENIKTLYESGNDYSRKSASRILYKWMPKFGFYYNTECISKFVVIPVLTAVEYFQNTEEVSTGEMIDFINNLYVDNYSTNSYFKTDIRNCSLSMPKEAQNLFRIVTEASLMTAALTESYMNAADNLINKEEQTQFNFAPGSFTVLQTQLEAFMLEENIEKMGARDFTKFYKKNDSVTNNEFLKVANALERQIAATPNRKNHVIDILRDGRRTYNFFKNLYVVNKMGEEYGSSNFLPSFYSSLGLIAGLEVVSSGNVINTFTGLDYHTNKKYSFTDWAAIVDYA